MTFLLFYIQIYLAFIYTLNMHSQAKTPQSEAPPIPFESIDHIPPHKETQPTPRSHAATNPISIFPKHQTALPKTISCFVVLQPPLRQQREATSILLTDTDPRLYPQGHTSWNRPDNRIRCFVAKVGVAIDIGIYFLQWGMRAMSRMMLMTDVED